MKKTLLFLLCAALPLQVLAWSFSFGDQGDRILRVFTVEDGAPNASKPNEVREALIYGGVIYAAPKVMRDRVAVDFPGKDIKLSGTIYCSKNPESFNCEYTEASLLNAIGAYGWKLHTLGGILNSPTVFTKPFK